MLKDKITIVMTTYLFKFGNVGNNTLAVPKPSFLIELTIIKVLIVNLRTKTSSQRSVKTKIFPRTLLLR